MNEFDRQLLSGFSAGSPFRVLRQALDTFVPAGPGIYAVTMPVDFAPRFITPGSGWWLKGRDPNVPIATLESKWVADTAILYIGGSVALRRRVGEYARFGIPARSSHWGGRYVWQLEQSQELTVQWRTIVTEPPHDAERDLRQRFVERHGRLPFANLVR